MTTITQARSALSAIKNIQRRIGRPEKWIQGDEANLENGDTTDPLDPKAKCFCMMGAARRVNRAENINYIKPSSVGLGLKVMSNVMVTKDNGSCTENKIIGANDDGDMTHLRLMMLLDFTVLATQDAIDNMVAGRA